MLTRTQFLIGLAAGTGGIAPNLVNLAHGFIGQTPIVPGWQYYVGVAIFFGLGAVVALIFAETDHRKAFFLGVSLPALIAAAQTQQQPRIPAAEPKAITGLMGVIPSANAQATPPSPAASAASSPDTNGKVLLGVKSSSTCDQCEVWFLNSKGKLLEKKYVANLEDTAYFPVPTGTAQFGIWNYKINPKIVSLPEGSKGKLEYEFGYKYNAWNDFKRGLGNYDLRAYDAELKAVAPSPGVKN